MVILMDGFQKGDSVWNKGSLVATLKRVSRIACSLSIVLSANINSSTDMVKYDLPCGFQIAS
jgi:hypothetical protein